MAISYFISILVLSIVSYSYIKKFLNVEIPKKDFMKILVSSLISFTFLYFATKITSGLLISLILVVVAGAIYITLLLLLGFYKREDIKVIEFLANKLPQFKSILYKIISVLRKFSNKYNLKF
jgi:hypothetical protein